MDISICKMSLSDMDNMKLSDFDDFWTNNILQSEVQNSDNLYIIAKEVDEIVGFAGVNYVLDEVHLANIAVRKDKRNKKIGSMLLEYLINACKNGYTSFTLEVNEKNSIAIKLYENYGFKKVGKRSKYYNRYR